MVLCPVPLQGLYQPMYQDPNDPDRIVALTRQKSWSAGLLTVDDISRYLPFVLIHEMTHAQAIVGANFVSKLLQSKSRSALLNLFVYSRSMSTRY
jgi:hypothetical protein